MSNFGTRTSRTNSVQFANGTATFQVDLWGGSAVSERQQSIDHLMGTLLLSLFDIVIRINKEVTGNEPPASVTRHTSTRSMTIKGVSVRVKMTLELTRKVASMVLYGYVGKILTAGEACMLHTIDPAVFDVAGDSLTSLVDDLPAGIRDALFGQGSPFGDTGDYYANRRM
jgi:hypothetical protein